MMLKKSVCMFFFLLLILVAPQHVTAENAPLLSVYQTGDSVSFEIEEHTGQLVLRNAIGQVRFLPISEETVPSYTISPYDSAGIWTVWLQKDDGLVEIGSFQVTDRERAKDDSPPMIEHIDWQFEKDAKLRISVTARDMETGIATVQATGFLAETQPFVRNEKNGEFELTLDLATWQEPELQLMITASDFDGNKATETRQIPVPVAVFDYQLNGQKLTKNTIVTEGDRLQIWTNRPKQVIEPFPYEWESEPLVGNYIFSKERLGEVFPLSNGMKLLYRENQQPFQWMNLLKNKRRVINRQEKFQKEDCWTFQAKLNVDYAETSDWRLTSNGHPVELKRQGDQLAADFHGQTGELILQYQDFDGRRHSLFLVKMIEILPITPIIQPEQSPVELELENEPQILQAEPHAEFVPVADKREFAKTMNESKKSVVEKNESAKKKAPTSMPFPFWLPVGVAAVILIFAQNRSK
ncbi:hypothetical protein [Listeria ilorinensis]|uniref:hypothetical protein n=1 Tax=Listeria ilorinensis TaxID=2867439 RepID=UPI001EF7502E|nr:hypothetical protein [Listeria ilorinensis]